MKSPQRAADEAARLAALRDDELLDTAPERALDDLTALAAHVCDAPISTITLIDEQRQWFKSTIGLTSRETPRVLSFCAHAILQSDMLVVPNALEDPTFCDNPLVVGEPHIRFYAGAPLLTPGGQALGTLCVIDRVPRQLTLAQRDALTMLARQVMAQLELRRQSRALVASQAESQRAEAAIQDSDVRYRVLFDHAPNGLLIADAENHYLDANASICRMLGYTREEFRRLRPADIVAPVEVPHIPVIIDAIKASSTDYKRDWVFRRKDGSLFHGDVTATQMPDGKLLAVIRDMTEPLAADARLRETEERARFALESAKVGVWDLDYATGTLRWSDVLERQCGLEPGGFPGTFEAYIALVHPDDRPALLATLGDAHRTGSDFTTQHRVMKPDGSFYWAAGAGRIHVDAQGQPVRGIGISIDVTERRLLEEQYQQAQKMEAMGRLAGGVAHDFNNLLTAILGYSELLLADCRPSDPRYGDIEAIQKESLRAASLTRQLLAFSRKQIIEPTVLDLNSIVVDMRSMLHRLIGEDISVVMQLDPSLGPVKADRGQMEQVVLNLALNARDAMAQGGTLTIATSVVEFNEYDARRHGLEAAGCYVCLALSDTGSGMTPQVKARLFEPFFTTKDVGKGTGLGLATVHGIVARSGGAITVQTAIGRGSAFRIYLPFETSAVTTEDDRVVATRISAGPQTILVVEDAEPLRQLAKRLLERLGHSVVLAADASEAIVAFKRHPAIDLLLTDVVMPGESGPSLARRLLKIRPALKVIYMSGYNEDTIVHRGILDPGISLLHKPFSADVLDRKISDVLLGSAV